MYFKVSSSWSKMFKKYLVAQYRSHIFSLDFFFLRGKNWLFFEMTLWKNVVILLVTWLGNKSLHLPKNNQNPCLTKILRFIEVLSTSERKRRRKCGFVAWTSVLCGHGQTWTWNTKHLRAFCPIWELHKCN